MLPTGVALVTKGGDRLEVTFPTELEPKPHLLSLRPAG